MGTLPKLEPRRTTYEVLRRHFLRFQISIVHSRNHGFRTSLYARRTTTRHHSSRQDIELGRTPRRLRRSIFSRNDRRMSYVHQELRTSSASFSQAYAQGCCFQIWSRTDCSSGGPEICTP